MANDTIQPTASGLTRANGSMVQGQKVKKATISKAEPCRWYAKLVGQRVDVVGGGEDYTFLASDQEKFATLKFEGRTLDPSDLIFL